MANGPKSVAHLSSAVGGSLINRTDDRTITVADVTHDSRQIEPGTLFVAIRGAAFDGHRFVPEAIAAGAEVICVDHPMGSAASELVVKDTRRALAILAAEVHGHPSHDMAVIGVTGTNGKTTVTHYIESIARSASMATGLIGTIHTRMGTETVPSIHTTPESSDFQRLLGQMRDLETDLVAVEVSSHALELERVVATRFAVAAFTNFSQDHLDFHGDMSSYLESKKKLFTEHEVGVSVVNLDDDAGEVIASSVAGDLLTVGSVGDISISDVRPFPRASAFRLSTPWGVAELNAPIIGAFNITNAVIAAGCALACGVTFDDVVAGVEALAPVPGRFEVVSGEDPVVVVVDFAHTPEGIAQAIKAAREITSNRVIALVGAGGDRDRQKRSDMGRAVSTADFSIITSDNPRSEDPASIARSVVEGIPSDSVFTVQLDRRSAIRIAVERASGGDVVLVLGKGHELFQEKDGVRSPFDDRVVAREMLQTIREATGSGEGSARQ